MKFRLATAVVTAFALLHGTAGAQVAAPSVPVPSPAPSVSPPPLPLPTAASPPPLVPAGVVPAAVDIELAGNVTARFALARVRAAIDALAARQPGTLLDVHGITLNANLNPGASLDSLAGVTIGGRGTFADVQGKTNVHIGVATLEPFEPRLLLYSDDPEYIGPTSDGVLLRGTLAANAPARLFLYHVAAAAPRRVSLVLQTTGTAARVQIVGAAVGPSPQFAYVGQQTTARFLVEHALGEGVLLDLTPDVPDEVPLANLQAGDLIEAIEDLRVVTGGPVIVSVVTSAAPAPLATLLGEPELAGDSHQRRGLYSLGDIAPIDLTLSIGEPEPDPVTVGGEGIANLRDGGRALGGDYGVTRRIDLHLANPTAAPQTAYLWERTAGSGGATVTILFDGEPAPTLIPCVNDSVQPRLVRAFSLPAGTSQTILGTYMTDGASSYPIEFGLTLTPPLAVPPGACNGAPSPAASPGESHT